jgi:hypothetical protein
MSTMFRIKIISTAVIAAMAVHTLGLFSGNSGNIMKYGYNSNEKMDDYFALWKKVDSLESKGLPQSSLEVVNTILSLAKKDNNGPQEIKATIHIIKYNRYLKEDDYVIALNNLQQMTNSAKAPQKQVLHSIVAETYWGFYQNNRYKFLGRTTSMGVKDDDIRTWDLRTISERIVLHYLLSLSQDELLKSTGVEAYLPILDGKPFDRHIRPSLFDFLAHRALAFFKNTEFDVTKPAYTFRLKDELHFALSDRFVQSKISTQDSLSTKYYALYLYKELTLFHLNDKEPDARVNLELDRLAFVRSHSQLPNKDTLYAAALHNLYNKYRDHEVSAEITYHIAQLHSEIGNQYKPLIAETNNYKWEKKRALQLCNDAIAKFPSSYGADWCKSLSTSLQQKSLNILAEDIIVPDRPTRLQISYKNVPRVWIRIVETGWDFEKRTYNEETEAYVQRILSQKLIREFEFDLKDDGDLQQHLYELEIPAMPKGHYMVVVGSHKDYSMTNQVVNWISIGSSNIAYTERRSDDESRLEFTVYDRITGKPIKGAKAQLIHQEYDYNSRRYVIRNGASYTTDANGAFLVKHGGRNERNFFVDFRTANDRLLTTRSYYQYEPWRDEKQRTQTHFFSDRAIYRPGQTIYFKGIRLRVDANGENAKIAANDRVHLTFYDNNHQKVSTLDLRTNEYGSFSGSFVTPTGVLTGQMYFTDGHGSHYFSVEEYKRPKFEAEFEPVKGAYKLNQKITVKGTAKAYAGSNIDGAKVSYRVTRTAYFPYRWYHWNYDYGYRSNQMEITFGETITKDDGTFEIEFDAIPDDGLSAKYRPAFNFTVTADITDINGETRSTSTVVNVGYTAMTLSTSTPEVLDVHSKTPIRIYAQNLNGEPIDASGNVTIHQLQQPDRILQKRRLSQPDRHQLTAEQYKKTFPNEQYSNELKREEWAKGKKTLETAFNTKGKDSILISDLRKWDPGHYVLEVTAKDPSGEEIKELHYFIVSDNKSAKMSFQEEFRVVGTNYKSYEPGEKAEILISTKWKDAIVLMEIEEKNKITSRQWIPISDEQKIISIPIEEKHRGNFGVHFTLLRNNRFHSHSEAITVPYSNKELEVEFETFRNKILPGSEEEWKVKVKGPKGEKMAAEMLVTMYDASLDAFASNGFYFHPYQHYYAQRQWSEGEGFASRNGQQYGRDWNRYHSARSRDFDRLNWFGLDHYYYYDYDYGYRGNMKYRSVAREESVAESEMVMEKLEAGNVALPGVAATGTATYAVSVDDNLSGGSSEKDKKKGEEKNQTRNGGGGEGDGRVQVRSNFSETAFFYPQLQTDAEGRVVFKFTAPESLTKWKLLGLTHTKELHTGEFQKEVLTQKDLMVLPFAPRFFREGDKIVFSTKVSNLSDKDLSGTIRLELIDPLTQKPVDAQFGHRNAEQNFSAKKGGSASASWNFSIPENMGAVSYRLIARSGAFSDGEEMAIPILTNRMMVTESMPLPIRKAGSKQFTFTKLVNSSKSSTLRHHKLTLEFTNNPAWYAIQAMPYMMEYPYECAEQVFTRFYANSIASHIVNSNPKIKAVFEEWKRSSPEAFLSNLEKNQELKSLMLEETPWVLEAQNESERKKRVAVLFDLNRMSNELERALSKLRQMQVSNGGWPWFPGMPESRYITQHIITGMGHLDHLGVKNVREDSKTWLMVQNGVKYLDARLVEDYLYLKRRVPNYKINQHIGYNEIQYLYARSYFKELSMDADLVEAMNYYKEQAKKYWLNFNLYAQGMLGLASHRFGMKDLSGDIVNSIREKAIRHDELGMYWKDNTVGYYWYQAPIETHALMIELFDEAGNDQETVEELKVWLLKNKQTSDWKTTKATAEACYALLLKGTDILTNDDMVEIKLGNEIVDPAKSGAKVEAGTGYFKTSWNAESIKPEMGKVTLTKKKDGVAWGAVYWQYFEQLDKITPHETPLKLSKKLFLVKKTATGPQMVPVDEKTVLEPGSRVRVKIDLRVDRAMEYVHMKDMRASCFEPVNVFSRYRWQDGLGYYESTRDAATNFFFEYLPKGTHVFEYDLLVTHQGDFSNGITTIQCMYAPEFTSHSEGIRVKVGQ